MRIEVRQQELFDCGPACIASVCRHYGMRISLERISRLCGTTAEGTTCAGMIHALESLGFQVRALKTNNEGLDDLRRPAIAHVILDGRTHFVVIVRVTATVVEFIDPEHGKIKKRPRITFQSWWTGSLIEIKPTEALKFTKHDPSSFRKIMNMVYPQRGSVITTTLIGFLNLPLIIMGAFVIKELFDRVAHDRQILTLEGPILNLFLILIGAYLLRAAFRFHAFKAINKCIDVHLSEYISKQPYQTDPTTTNREAFCNIKAIAKFIHSTVPTTIVSLTTIAALTCLMWTWSTKLTMLVVVLAPIQMYIAKTAGLLFRKQRQQSRSAQGQFFQHLQRVIHYGPSLFRMEFATPWLQKAKALLTQSVDARRERNETKLFARTLHGVITYASAVSVLWMGTTYFITSWVTLGKCIAFVLLVPPVHKAWLKVVSFSHFSRQALAAAENLEPGSTLFEDRAQNGPKGVAISSAPATKTHDIEFDAVSFRYPKETSTAVSSVSFHLTPATISVIVGEPDSGKSTLLKLMTKEIVPTEGSITLGGRDLTTIDFRGLNRFVTIATQQDEVLPATVLENIVGFDPEPDWRRIIDLSQSLGLRSHIDRLPYGYHTPVGAGGEFLSRCEIRKLMIARAFYSDRPIILLDDPTTGLDRSTQHALARLLVEEKAKGKTIVLVANNAPTLVIADQVLVLEDGRLSAAQATPVINFQ